MRPAKIICEVCGTAHADMARHQQSKAHRHWAEVTKATREGFVPISGAFITLFRRAKRPLFAVANFNREAAINEPSLYVRLDDAEDILGARLAAGNLNELTQMLDATVRAVKRSQQAAWWFAMWEGLQDVAPDGKWLRRVPGATWWIPPAEVFQRLAAEVEQAARSAD